MTVAPHIPALRRGQSYLSLEQMPVSDHRTGRTLATISQVNAGIIRRDLMKIADSRALLKRHSVEALIRISAEAGERFLQDTLPLGDQGHGQSPQEYVACLAATSGLPHVMVKRNMSKIHYALTNMDTIVNGLTRGLDFSILDRGYGEQNGTQISFFPASQCLGLVMPSNSPAVNSLWLPAIPLKSPVVIKPGREEPWTPYRLIQAFIAAGCPSEAFGFYPTDHEGAGDILRLSGRAMLFGDQQTTAPHAHNPAIQIHGPGFSKILVGHDEIDHWPAFISLMVSSIAENGGRSCINASTVVVPRQGREIAAALAQELGPVQPLAAEDEKACLAGFANPKLAEHIDTAIEADLGVPGAEEMTAPYRGSARKVSFQGSVYLRPTIVHCESFAHPLANREFLFPYASVVEVPQDQMLMQIGPSLVVTALTKDPRFMDQLLDCPLIDRLNLGPISTVKVSWDQPHEGNMFDFLYRRRAFERIRLKAA